MKTQEIAILGGAALFAYFLLTKRQVVPTQVAGNASAPDSRTSIFNRNVLTIPNTALPTQAGYGWQYFSDGTTIGPDGSYYKNGVLVWSPSA